jgi:hypothetical protein
LDERELAELFRDAAQTIPPASFDVHDVQRAARRATARRRIAVAGTTLVAAALLAGGIGVGLGRFGGTPVPQAAVPNSPLTRAPSPSIHDQHSGPILLTPGPCGPPDPALASALAEQLPAAAGMPPVSARSGCPDGARNAAFQLRDGASAGEVIVVLVPADRAAPAGESRGADGARQVTSRTRSGQVLMVLSDPEAGSPDAPYASRLAAIAGELAPRF